MILVEWKGDDDNPYQLTFHPHLTVIAAHGAERQHMVNDLASAFQPDSGDDAVVVTNDVGCAPNFLHASDGPWLLGSADRRPGGHVWQQLYDDALAQLQDLEARIEESQPSRSPNPPHDGLAQHSLDRLARLLEDRRRTLELALERPIADHASVANLCRTHEERVSQPKEAALRSLLAPQWLITQSWGELEAATREVERLQLDSDDLLASPEHLTSALARLAEAEVVWEELHVNQVIDPAAQPKDLEQEAHLRTALRAEGLYISHHDDPLEIAWQWVRAREADWAERERQQDELAAVHADLDHVARLQAQYRDSAPLDVVIDTDGPAEDHGLSLLKASAQSVRERLAFLDDQRYSHLLRDPDASIELSVGDRVLERLQETIDQGQSHLGQSVFPLVLDTVIDQVEPQDQVEALDALLALAGDWQIVYFTEDEAILRWAEEQDADRVALRHASLR